MMSFILSVRNGNFMPKSHVNFQLVGLKLKFDPTRKKLRAHTQHIHINNQDECSKLRSAHTFSFVCDVVLLNSFRTKCAMYQNQSAHRFVYSHAF